MSCWGSILCTSPMKESCWRSALLKMPDVCWAAMERHPLGAGACVIGKVTAENPGLVTMRTALGATRIVDMLTNDPLPRIC